MNKGHPQLEARVLSTTPHTKVYLSPTPIPAINIQNNMISYQVNMHIVSVELYNE